MAAAPNRIGPAAEQLAAALPALLVAAERVAATVVQGVHGRRRVGSGETFWQYRRYQGGDSASAIDWRQSAKSQKTFVRENEWEAAQSVWLWRDRSASMDYQSGAEVERKQDRADLLLLALASLLLRGGEHVGLYGQDNTATGGRATLNRLGAHLQARRGITPAQSGLPEAGRLPRFAQLVLFGDFLAPMDEVEAMVERFADQGARGQLVQILDPAEEDLPFLGRTEFEGPEDEGRLLIGRVESLRDGYLQRMAARRQSLRDITRRAGWGFAAHRTDRPPQTVLLALYNALSNNLAGNLRVNVGGGLGGRSGP
ncbi:MAG: DUF58 domain-containing protein [Alphaproteobacteria bacterium]|nr:DUF58 domain-containing protein [Alphaproteobacteria bacterium]MDP6829855.1 DUF58 domain-containing protein [Alphaproteobacteria bacterium]MDP6875689.1 DUF58 domain-containing protein [Alphaproteobacteria bacterium]